MIGEYLSKYAIEHKGIAGRDHDDCFNIYIEHQDNYDAFVKDLNEKLGQEVGESSFKF